MAAGINNENENTTPRRKKSLTALKHHQKISYQHQRWSEYNTNVLEYEYDYFEHA